MPFASWALVFPSKTGQVLAPPTYLQIPEEIFIQDTWNKGGALKKSVLPPLLTQSKGNIAVVKDKENHQRFCCPNLLLLQIIIPLFPNPTTHQHMPQTFTLRSPALKAFPSQSLSEMPKCDQGQDWEVPLTSAWAHMPRLCSV